MKQNLKLEKNLAFKNQIKREFEFSDDKTDYWIVINTRKSIKSFYVE